jgi:hypothetical protein
MTPELIYRLQIALGTIAWLVLLRAYGVPRLRFMDSASILRVVAAIHSFRFVGLMYLLPGVVGPHLPQRFAISAAYGNFAASVLAVLALVTFARRSLFWLFVAAFNLVGIGDIVFDYMHTSEVSLPAIAGQLGAAYIIPVLYVPVLMMTHGICVFFFIRQLRHPAAAQQPRRDES